jgi:rhomboid protease GluP
MDKRRMCPHCRAFITTDDRVCPYCGERVGPKAAQLGDTGELIGGLIPQARFVTILLLIINGGLFLATALYPGWNTNPNIVLYFFGAKEGHAIWQGHEWWRVITAGFLHGGMLHILMNGWVMMDLGAQIEIVYGPARLIVFYVVTSAAGFLLSAWWSPVLSIGASAALFGFIGAMIALGVANPSSVGRMVRGIYTRWAIYGLAYGFIPVVLGVFGIQLPIALDNAAHIGGLAAGFGIGYVAGIPAHSTYARERAWQIAAAACVLVTLVSFYLVYLHFPRQTQ